MLHDGSGIYSKKSNGDGHSWVGIGFIDFCNCLDGRHLKKFEKKKIRKKKTRVATGTKRILLPQIRESYEATNDTLGKGLKTIRPAKSWTGHPVQQERLWLVG